MTLGCVLAGGRSSRMGEDKALLRWRGRSLVEHALGLLRAAGLRPVIAGNRPELAEYGPMVEDQHPGCGPLAGIEAALSAVPGDDAGAAVLFVPVDLPLLPVSFLGLLVERAERTGAMATVPVLGGRAQPLVAVYRRALLPGISAALDAGDYKVTRVVEGLTELRQRDIFRVEAMASAREIPQTGERRLPVYRWFANANTPADWAALQTSQDDHRHLPEQ